MIARTPVIVVLSVLLVAVPVVSLAANEQPDVVVFSREECNDCRHMDGVLDELLRLYP